MNVCRKVKCIWKRIRFVRSNNITSRFDRGIYFSGIALMTLVARIDVSCTFGGPLVIYNYWVKVQALPWTMDMLQPQQPNDVSNVATGKSGEEMGV